MRHRSIALLLCSSTALLAGAQSQLHLIPLPRQVVQLHDQPITDGVTIVCTACNLDDAFAADDLRQSLTDRGIPTGVGLRIVLHRLAAHPDATFTAPMRPEGYTIHYADNTLTLTGATAAGVFYAAQTAKQLIDSSPTGFTLHAADIHDWPAMK